MSVQAITLSANDEDRRAKLRIFLTNCRARLRPENVGLPSTARRRVTGLRREEIAELVGVSSDWYRWFESGRPIRVSVPFLARLSRALQLNPIEKLALFYLALPELYEAYIAQRRSEGLEDRCA
jgi:Helix-turn-helix domain